MILASVFQDTRIAARVFSKEKSFFIIAVLILAIGICGVTTMFSLANGVLWRGLPFPSSEKLVSIFLRNPARPDQLRTLHTPDFKEWQRQQQTCEGLAACYNQRTLNVTLANAAERIFGAYVTHNFFSVLGVRPTIGRDFSLEDDRSGAGRVALISDQAWKRHFGGSPDIVGRAFRIEGQLTKVIGVMPPGISFPSTEEIWLPFFSQFPEQPTRSPFPAWLIGRLKPSASLDEASAEFAGLAHRLAEEFPETNRDFASARVEPLLRTLTVSGMRDMLFVMLAAAAVVLVISCVNVMNLQFARASARSRELAVRSALGASRGRLIRQMLTEGLLLVSVGSVLGGALSFWTTGLLHSAMAQLPFGSPPAWINVQVDLPVLAFAIGVGALVVLGSSLIPAWMSSRVDPAEVMKEGGPGATSGRFGVVSQALVILQVALSTILLVAALLQVKSIRKQTSLDLGFDPDAVMSARMGLGADYRTPAALRAFVDRLLRELRANPEFTHAAVTSLARMVVTNPSSNYIEIDGIETPANQRGFLAAQELVSDGYFAALGISPRVGREFTAAESAQNPPALVNESFARKYLAGVNPLGLRLRHASLPGQPAQPWRVIVGVVPDTLMQGPLNRERDGAGLFLPWGDLPSGSFITVLVRGHTDAATLAEPLRRAVSRLDPNLPIYAVGTPRFNLLGSLGDVRVVSALFSLFAITATVLAAVGLYAITSYAVNRRVREFGIRMALGADRPAILRLILRQGGVQFVVGTVVGIGLALSLTRWSEPAIAGFLYKIHPRDPVVFAVVVALLGGATLLACLAPAWRATRVSPAVVLRTD